MSTSMSAILGLIFLGLANASVFLMFKLWGYPFDKEDAYECRSTRVDAAPPAHRLCVCDTLCLYDVAHGAAFMELPS